MWLVYVFTQYNQWFWYSTSIYTRQAQTFFYVGLFSKILFSYTKDTTVLECPSQRCIKIQMNQAI